MISYPRIVAAVQVVEQDLMLMNRGVRLILRGEGYRLLGESSLALAISVPGPEIDKIKFSLHKYEDVETQTCLAECRTFVAKHFDLMQRACPRRYCQWLNDLRRELLLCYEMEVHDADYCVIYSLLRSTNHNFKGMPWTIWCISKVLQDEYVIREKRGESFEEAEM